ncbi:DUF4336 domain-containing protein [Leptolyngbya sp. CCY15150]|uniref:DUF4336 domain-containing protein n=1 Tax=Leptolyngbya sp. CCY15150 TaxID=2767772 RepID=UPI00194EA1E4|nr:DUF4336 domain-containing protein [Leptolyngbya sp. CCY15150]
MQEHDGHVSPTNTSDWTWPFWPIVPIYPYGQRRTLRQEVVPDWIWTFDQCQGILYVIVPIRMTVVRLEAGGLLVYAPIAPTRECMRLLRDLEARYGQVQHIILPTVSGIEHKVFVGPFARQCPEAQVWIAPDQWSFPVNLPLSWLGLPRQRTRALPMSGNTPFAQEFDYAILGPINLGLGPFEEVALFHRRSRTLLVTDCVVSVPEQPPAIIQQDPYPLLFHAKDHGGEIVEDQMRSRLKGWKRIVLFAFYFRPSALEVVGTLQSIQDAFKASDRSRKAYFGWYPFRWQDTWEASFETLRANGQLFVAPILQTLILNRAPVETLNWVERVARWDFQRIIPCHLDAPIQATPEQFRQAFAFLNPYGDLGRLPMDDLDFLQQIERSLSQRGITPPARLNRP